MFSYWQNSFDLKPLFIGVLFLNYYFKKHFRPCFFILKALKDILKHFKFVNWRIILSYYSPNFLCIIWSKSRFHWFFILGSNFENFYNFVTVCILCTSKLFFHIFKGKQNTKLDFFCFVRSAPLFFCFKVSWKGLNQYKCSKLYGIEKIICMLGFCI